MKRPALTLLFSFLTALAVTFIFPAMVRAATLFLTPSKGDYAIGDTISVALKVNAGGQAINASSAVIGFPKDLLQFSSVSKAGSIFTFWAEEPSAGSGRLTYSGGLPNPGFRGSSGTILTLTFLAKTTGPATITISNGKVLANDGFGTNIISGQGSAAFTIAAKKAAPSPTPATPFPAPTVSSTTHPDPEKWYAAQTASLSWSQPAGLKGASYSLTDALGSDPGSTVNTTKNSLDLRLPAEGIWFFHLKAIYPNGASAIVHYRLQFDATAPQPFTLSLLQDRGKDDPSPQVIFEAADAVSGIAKYTISVDGGEAAEVKSPATIQVTRAGTHHVVVTAFDRSGNARQASLDFAVTGYPAPIITFVSSPLILLDSLVVKGTARQGDTVVVYVSEQEIGRVIAGVPGTTEPVEVEARADWALTTDRLFRPGSYRLTAVAISADKQSSVPSDFAILTVAGHQVVISGRIVATVAIIPAVSFLVIFFAILVILALYLLVRSLNALRTREAAVDQEVEVLEERIRRGKMTLQQVDSSLQKIDQELHSSKKRRPSSSRKSA